MSNSIKRLLSFTLAVLSFSVLFLAACNNDSGNSSSSISSSADDMYEIYNTKEKYEERINLYINTRYGINVDTYLDEIEEEYGEFLNDRISKNDVRIAIADNQISKFFHSYGQGNVTGVSPYAIDEVNKLLEKSGKEPIEVGYSDYKESMIVLWIAACKFYNPSFESDVPELGRDLATERLANAFAVAKSDYSQINKQAQESYYILYLRLKKAETLPPSQIDSQP